MTDLPDVRPGDVWKDNDPRGGPGFEVVQVCPSPLGSGCRSVAEGAEEPHVHLRYIGEHLPRMVPLHYFQTMRPSYTLVKRDDDS